VPADHAPDPPLGSADRAPFAITGSARERLICAAPGAAGPGMVTALVRQRQARGLEL
jgi:hypothetical protein